MCCLPNCQKQQRTSPRQAGQSDNTMGAPVRMQHKATKQLTHAGERNNTTGNTTGQQMVQRERPDMLRSTTAAAGLHKFQTTHQTFRTCHRHTLSTPQAQPSNTNCHTASACIACASPYWLSNVARMRSVREHMAHSSDRLLKVIDLLVKAQALHIELVAQPHTHVSARGIDGDE